MSYYCPKCGSKAELVGCIKPKFCPGCGYELNSLSLFLEEEKRSSPSSNKRPKAKITESVDYESDAYDAMEEDDENEDGFTVDYAQPKAKRGTRGGLEGVNVSIPEASKITMGELAFQQRTGGLTRDRIPGVGRRPSSKSIIDSFKKENSSSRNKFQDLS